MVKILDNGTTINTKQDLTKKIGKINKSDYAFNIKPNALNLLNLSKIKLDDFASWYCTEKLTVTSLDVINYLKQKATSEKIKGNL